MNLTLEQRAAVERWGQDVCVMAGPGSGKTAVLVERYAWLIHEKGFRPSQVLAITFTEKAAQEIKERLSRRFAQDSSVRQEIERAPVATIHGFGARLLRRYAIPAGLDPQFSILDEVSMNAELHAAIKASLDQMAAERRDDLRMLLSAWNTDQPVEHLAELHDAWRSSGGSLEDLMRQPPPAEALGPLLEATRDLIGSKPGWLEWRDALARAPFDFALLRRGELLVKGSRGTAAKLWRERVKQYHVAALTTYYAPARELLVSLFSKLVQDVERRKFERGVLDFGDLESRAIALLENHPEIRARVQQEYEAILMDELQDTNPLQWRLMNLVRREGRFFGVGDLNQAIFGFRHATPDSFREYRDGLRRSLQEVDELRGNYRSRAEILRVAMDIVAEAPGLEPPLLEARRVFPDHPSGVVEALLTEAPTTPDREQLEAEHVARRMRELHETGTRYSSIALLVRQTTGLGVFEQALRSFGVPYVMNLGRGFFESIEVTDLVNWLRIVANPRDEIALVGVLRSPLAGYSDEEIYAMRLQAPTLMEGAPAEFAVRLGMHRSRASAVGPERLLACAIDESGYALDLNAPARANVDKLLTLVREWWQADPVPIADIVRRLDERALEREPNAPSGDGADAVNVMTMHGAKGLEFPVVFLCGLHRTGSGGRSAPISFSPVHGLGVTWRDPATGNAVADAPQQANLEAEGERERDEANRLFYVAMTRAEERLIFTWSEAKQQRSKWPDMVRRCMTSRVEAGPPERWSLDGATEVAMVPPLLLQPIASAEPWDGQVTVAELAGARDPAMPVGFEATELGERAARAAKLERDWDFVVEVDGVMVEGVVPLWFIEGGELVVVDFGTDGVRAGLYAAVLERHLKRRARAFACSHEGALEVSAADAARLVERWKQSFVSS